MEILVISCIHNDVENMMVLVDRLEGRKFDVVVCPGDFTDYKLPPGFTQRDLAKIVIEELRTISKNVIAVPGSWDKEIIDLLDKEKVSVHGKGRIIDGVGFYGYGGGRTPFNTPFEPSDEEIAKGLKNAYKDVEKSQTKIQITHMPPAGTRTDVIFSGAHVGSEAIRKFIEENSPAAAICSHIHEARGIDTLNKTKIINSGRFPEGYVGIISLKEGNVSAEVVNLI